MEKKDIMRMMLKLMILLYYKDLVLNYKKKFDYRTSMKINFNYYFWKSFHQNNYYAKPQFNKKNDKNRFNN